MKLSMAAASLVLFLVSLFLLVLLTLFESSLSGLSTTAERLLSALLLVLPAVLGAVFGVLSILRREASRGMAVLGLAMNSLFALFHIFVLTFAG